MRRIAIECEPFINKPKKGGEKNSEQKVHIPKTSNGATLRGLTL